MTIVELKSILEESHKRDVRLIVIGAIVNAIGAALVIWLLTIIGLDFGRFASGIFGWGETGSSFNIIVIAVIFFAVIGFSLMKLLPAKKRIEKIDKFIDHIQAKDVANSIMENNIPRIVIHLIKIKLNLAHVSTAVISFPNDKTVYSLPFPSVLMPELKTLLSGVSDDNVNEIYSELYNNNNEGSDNTSYNDYEIKSEEEFRDFASKELVDDIQNIESQRVSTRKKQLIGISISLVISFCFVGFMFFKSDMFTSSNSYIVILFLLAGAGYLIYNVFKKGNPSDKVFSSDVRHEFKTKVFKKVVSFIDPSLNYVMHGHISLPEFIETGFFYDKYFEIDGNDQIIGRYRGVPFQFCDLSVIEPVTFKKENEEPEPFFIGQVFIAKFNKSFCNRVFIVPRKSSSIFSSGNLPLYTGNLGEKVKLEDPEFSKMFDVYADDQIEARYILSMSLMERLKKMKENTKGELIISFINNRISILNNSGDNRFEVSVYKSITKNEQAVEFYKELCNQLYVIDDLKLNDKLWA